MKINYFNIAIAVVLLGMVSCKPTLDEYTPTAANVDFSKYVAIGNSLTAGYANNGLYLAGQKVAYPNLIAEQLKQVGGGAFNTPFFTEAQANGSGYIRLKSLTNGQPVLEPVTDKLAYRSASPKLLTKYTDPINNLGVPGMRMDMAFAPGIGTVMGNMYFERLLPEGSPATTTYFSYATSQNHTFFSFGLGNNDALGYATNGAVQDGATSTLTATATFTTRLNEFINALTTNDRKGVIATIPDVTATPFFTTVTEAALIAGVKAQNPSADVKDIYILTKTGVRAATEKDYFVLPFSSAGLLGKPNAAGAPYGLHPANPVEDKYVLDESEAKTVSSRIDEFNAAIKTVAKSKNLALADVHDFLNNVKSGIRINGLLVSANYITGNGFSLDGIHLTPIGNALMANVFINAINSTYHTRIPVVNVSSYHGVDLP